MLLGTGGSPFLAKRIGKGRWFWATLKWTRGLSLLVSLGHIDFQFCRIWTPYACSIDISSTTVNRIVFFRGAFTIQFSNQKISQHFTSFHLQGFHLPLAFPSCPPVRQADIWTVPSQGTPTYHRLPAIPEPTAATPSLNWNPWHVVLLKLWACFWTSDLRF